MKISQLVSELLQIQQKCGDLFVSHTQEWAELVEEVKVWESQNGKDNDWVELT